MSAARRRIVLRLGLALGTLALALAALELVLLATDQPRFYTGHSMPPRFRYLPNLRDGFPMYLNRPSSKIRFEYEDDPRGYFDEGAAIEHPTNSWGFRGPELTPDKPAGTFRIVFLGDSVTFGEGVHLRDTYPRRTVELLARGRSAGEVFEDANFAVGGHNTTEQLFVLENLALPTEPDLVVLGYVLNDAEPPLYQWDPVAKEPFRRTRDFEEWFGSPAPPEGLVYRSRIARYLWSLDAQKGRGRGMIDYYRSLYAEANPDWQESRRALRRIAEICAERETPFVVVLFPILIDLDENYPLAAIHTQIADALAGTGAILVDLFPAFDGHAARDLWVHPSDHHPNDVAHGIAAETLAERLLSAGVLSRQ